MYLLVCPLFTIFCGITLSTIISVSGQYCGVTGPIMQIIFVLHLRPQAISPGWPEDSPS